MKIKNLINNVEILESYNLDYNLNIKSLSDNSTKCKNESLFFCVNGFSCNGENYVNQAVKNGAIAIVCEHKLNVKIAQIIVKDVRKTMSLMCANFYNNCHKKLKIIGIIGTNGKTSCSKTIKAMLENLDKEVGFIGTNMVCYNNSKYETSLTTPDPLQLHKIFKDMVKCNVEYCIIEVSAHAIFLNKVYGIKFETLLFTNISQDHLDFFGSMDNYANVKMNFFNLKNAKSCVINIDDEYGRGIVKNTNLPIITYGIKNPSEIFAINIKLSLEGSEFVVNVVDDIFKVKTCLSGMFNVYNLLGCIGVLKIIGFSEKDIKNASKNLQQVEGRFNLIKCGQKFNIILDYAHTPKSFECLLSNVKNLTKNKNICVFGCPGNRDELKRSIMGEIAGKFCDFVIITADNPQYENSFLIMKEIEKGIKNTNCQYLLIEDRKLAIKCAMSVASNNSNLLILGKGIESYQNINGFEVPYSDLVTIKECVREYLQGDKINLKNKKNVKNLNNFIY